MDLGAEKTDLRSDEDEVGRLGSLDCAGHLRGSLLAPIPLCENGGLQGIRVDEVDEILASALIAYDDAQRRRLVEPVLQVQALGKPCGNSRVVLTLVQRLKLGYRRAHHTLPGVEVARTLFDPGSVQGEAGGAHGHSRGSVRIARLGAEDTAAVDLTSHRIEPAQCRLRAGLEQDRVAGRRVERLDTFDCLADGCRSEHVCGPNQPDEVVSSAEPS